MALMSANAIAKKWGRNMQAAGPSYVEGVDAVTESPMEKAVAQKEVMVANFQAAVNSGKWAQRTLAVSVADWKRVTKEKGAARMAQGIPAGETKQQKFFDQFLPHLQAGQQKLQAMPRGGLEQNLQRMVANARHNSEFTYRP